MENAVKQKKTGEVQGAKKTVAKKRKAISFSEPYRISLPTLLLALALLVFGLVVLFSASIPTAYVNDAPAYHYVLRQILFSFIGVLISCVLIFIRPIKSYNRIALVMSVYLGTLVLLILTMIPAFSQIRYNARRWLVVGNQEIQTSEVAKIALVFCIAGYRAFIVHCREKGGLICKTRRRQEFLNAFVDIILPVSLVGIQLILIFRQPHVSGFFIISVVTLICFLASGIKIKSWIDGGLTLFVALLVIANGFMLFSSTKVKDDLLENYSHVWDRLSIFQTINEEDSKEPEISDSDDADTYQSDQARIAIGSGGLFGVGLGNSRQKFLYLPEAHNDYVFAIACEELGFIGGVSIIFLFWAFMCCGLSIALKARGIFPRILALGYTSLVALQAFLNIAVSAGVIPPTGITMPFFSYGGSANMFFIIAVGMILAVSRSGVRRKKRTYI